MRIANREKRRLLAAFFTIVLASAMASHAPTGARGGGHSVVRGNGPLAYTALDPPTLASFQTGIALHDLAGGTRHWLVTRIEATQPSFAAGGLLAFSNSSGIWVDRPVDGAQLVSRRQFAENPALSPDGRTIAYDDGDFVWSVGTDGRGDRKLHSGRSPSWSPDGRRLVVEQSGDLVLLSATGSEPMVLLRAATAPCGSGCMRDVFNEAPAWSPNGREIAFARGGDIFSVQVTGGPARRITRTEPWEDHPAWSRDGSKLAMSRRNGEIYVVDRRGQEIQRVTRTDVAEIHPAWRPDGLLAFAAPPDPELYLWNRGMRAAQQLTRNDAIEANVEWSPDRSMVSFTRGARADGGLWIMRADGTGERRLGWLGATIRATDWSHDGRRILVATEHGVSVVDVSGSGVQRLTRSFAYDAAWSPDGRRVAFVDGPAIHVIDVDGTDRRQLARVKGDDPNHLDFAYVDWGSRGRIAYSLEGRGAPVLVVVSESGRRVRQLHGSSPSWSRDGRWLAFVDRGIRVTSADGTFTRRCTAASPSSRHPDWTTERGLAFVRDDGIWEFDACGNTPVRLVRAQQVGVVEAFG